MPQRLFGRALTPVDTAFTVWVRAGRTHVGDGPIPGTGDFLAGLDVIECADLDAALLGSRSDSVPHLLLGWQGTIADAAENRVVIDAIEAWRDGLVAAGRHLMGSSFGGVEATAALALRDVRTLAADSPFIAIAGNRATVDVIAATDRPEAVALAARHPLATRAMIEARAFDTGPPL